MNGGDVRVLLYAVDLDELRSWVGCRDPARFEEARRLLHEDGEWEPEELEVLERLLRRLVFEGKLYEGLSDDERYYMTQLLIDLFDEFVDQEALGEELPLPELLKLVEAVPPDSETRRLLNGLIRGRELDGERLLWEQGPVEEGLAYFGYVTREEAPRLVAGIDAYVRTARGRPSGLWKALRNAAEECARAGLDLVSFVG